MGLLVLLSFQEVPDAAVEEEDFEVSFLSADLDVGQVAAFAFPGVAEVDFQDEVLPVFQMEDFFPVVAEEKLFSLAVAKAVVFALVVLLVFQEEIPSFPVVVLAFAYVQEVKYFLSKVLLQDLISQQEPDLYFYSLVELAD